MKIVYITHFFPPAACVASINTYRIVKGLTDRGHQLTVLCPQTFSKYTPLQLQNKNQPFPFEVYHSSPTPLPLSITVPHLFNALRALKHRYDLVITQFHLFHLASLMGFLLKTLKRKPWVIRVHDMIYDPTVPYLVSDKAFINSCFGAFLKASYGVFLKNLGKKADKVFVMSRELQSLLLRNSYPPDKVALFPNGVDTQIFTPSISKGNYVKKKTILYIGSMLPEDGLNSLVRAFALLDREKELNLTLIGNGPERLQLMELVKKLNLEQKVTFHKHVPHEVIQNFIRRAYLTVGQLGLSTINSYGIPVKMLEYFACGKPVVSAPVSKDILIDGFTGLVVRNPTPKNIAEKFSIMIEDEKLVAQMGKNARQLVVERFDWDKVIDRIEKKMKLIELHRIN